MTASCWRIGSLLLLLVVVGVQSLSLQVNRRDALVVAGGSLASVACIPSKADAANKPIAVIGANGRTGSLCVEACLERGIPVRALTRSGTFAGENPLLSVAACDVKDIDALSAGVAGCSGVIYAASASKKGGSAKEIDNLGVVAAGDACLSQKVPRYVVISSTATTRPQSLGYKFTNVLGGIMDEKKRGEDGVVASFSKNSSSSYVIIRPGGLEEPKKNVVLGPSALEISQGDVLAGIVSRADLAQVAVEACLSPKLQNAAFELYYTDSVQPCEGRFKPYLTNGSVARLHGSTYEELFAGIKSDGDYAIPV